MHLTTQHRAAIIRRRRNDRARLHSPHAFVLQPLEPRLLLSGLVTLAAEGVVTAVLSGTTLTITGDDDVNEIAIVTNAVGSETNDLVVASPFTLNLTGDTGGVFLNVQTLIIKMKGGSDTVTVGRLAGVGAVTIDMGEGNNATTLDSQGSQLAIGKDLKITGGSGDDDVALFSAAITGAVTIDAGGGINHIVMDLDDIGEPAVTVGKDVKITTGAGVDIISLNAIAFSGSLTVDSGAGADTVLVRKFGENPAPTMTRSPPGKATTPPW